MTDFFEKLNNEFVLPLSNPVLFFSVILLIILLAPVLLKRLNIPGIIGLIISGVIIGPHGFNVLENNFAMKLFSTIGLLYIMFIAGLELDLNEFKANKNKSLVFGFFTFIIPLSIGYPAMYYLLGYWYNFDFNASFLTASMFATHTLVAYPIVSRLGVSKNQAVAITVGGTILTDTAVLIVLAIIVGNHKGTLDTAFWIQLGISLLIFSAIMFILIPRIAKWFFKKLESEKHAHYIFVLSVVFFAAFLAEVAGIESIIGAFVAGLALNPLIPQSSALMNRVEFIGNSLFIPFFLISVGMLVDISVILQGWEGIIVALVLSIVALSGKWLAAWITQIVYKYTGAQRQLIFGLSGGHAAATLAVILVGYREGILDDGILNGTIILILITCVVASFAAEKAAKKIAIAEEKDVSVESLKGRSEKSEQILFPISDSSTVESLLDFALIIKDKNSENPVSLLSVVPNDSEAEINLLKQKKDLEKFISQGSAAETKVNIISTIDHNQSSGIARISKETSADIIIMSWPEKGSVLDLVFGDKMGKIISGVDRILIFCRFAKPLIEKKRLIYLCPPFAERESGFKLIIQKVMRIAQEYSMTIMLYAEEKTYSAIQKIIKESKLSGQLKFTVFSDWDDFLIISKDLQPTDLIVFNSARRSSVSYKPALEKVPSKLIKYFSKNSLIVIYPQDVGNYSNMDLYEDFTGTSMTKGVETIENFSKGIGSIFRRKKK